MGAERGADVVETVYAGGQDGGLLLIAAGASLSRCCGLTLLTETRWLVGLTDRDGTRTIRTSGAVWDGAAARCQTRRRPDRRDSRRRTSATHRAPSLETPRHRLPPVPAATTATTVTSRHGQTQTAGGY